MCGSAHIYHGTVPYEIPIDKVCFVQISFCVNHVVDVKWTLPLFKYPSIDEIYEYAVS